MWINASSYYGRVQYELKVCSCRPASIPLVVQCVRFTDRRIHLPLEINTDRLFTNVIEWYGWSMLLHPLIHHLIQPRCTVVQWTCSVIHVNHTAVCEPLNNAFKCRPDGAFYGVDCTHFTIFYRHYDSRNAVLYIDLYQCVYTHKESSFRPFCPFIHTHPRMHAHMHAHTNPPTHIHLIIQSYSKYIKQHIHNRVQQPHTVTIDTKHP